MKKSLIITLVALGAIALASSAFAQIGGSHHDMTSAGADVDSSISACEFCHTPHNSNDAVTGGERLPLWNRSNPVGAFTAYGTTVANTDASGQPGSNSLTCLSCHDGSVALNAVFNGKSTGTANFMSATNFDRAFIGKNLADDHPVGFTFIADANLADQSGHGVPSTVFGGTTTSPFRLYGGTASAQDGQFECASCHDPHDTVTGDTANANTGFAGGPGGSSYFLRAPIASICVDCHANK